jgi:hypothetical protein
VKTTTIKVYEDLIHKLQSSSAKLLILREHSSLSYMQQLPIKINHATHVQHNIFLSENKIRGVVE